MERKEKLFDITKLFLIYSANGPSKRARCPLVNFKLCKMADAFLYKIVFSQARKKNVINFMNRNNKSFVYLKRIYDYTKINVELISIIRTNKKGKENVT